MSRFTARVVDNLDSLEECIAELSSPTVAQLAIDLEGVDLCRHGCLSIIQILADTSRTVWLVDVTTLGNTAFAHVDAEGHSLKLLLESSATQKLFFDVRSDADALYHLYGITINNVYDLQLLEVAMKRSQGNKAPYVTGLARVIDTYLGSPREWKKVKDEGAALFQPERGGTYEVFERRPLDPRIIAYSAQDVALLFDLKRTLQSRMGIWFSDWRARVARASAARVAESRQPYQGKGMHRAIAPQF